MGYKKITFEKLDDNSCVISISGENIHGQKFIVQDIVKPTIYDALKEAICSINKRTSY